MCKFPITSNHWSWHSFTRQHYFSSTAEELLFPQSNQNNYTKVNPRPQQQLSSLLLRSRWGHKQTIPLNVWPLCKAIGPERCHCPIDVTNQTNNHQMQTHLLWEYGRLKLNHFYCKSDPSPLRCPSNEPWRPTHALLWTLHNLRPGRLNKMKIARDKLRRIISRKMLVRKGSKDVTRFQFSSPGVCQQIKCNNNSQDDVKWRSIQIHHRRQWYGRDPFISQDEIMRNEEAKPVCSPASPEDRYNANIL